MPTTQKTKTILFRVSECDYALLVQAAGQLTLSAYIRAILFNQELPKARAHKKPLKDQEQLSKALGMGLHLLLPKAEKLNLAGAFHHLASQSLGCFSLARRLDATTSKLRVVVRRMDSSLRLPASTTTSRSLTLTMAHI